MHLPLVLSVGQASVLFDFSMRQIEAPIDGEVLLDGILAVFVRAVHYCFEGQSERTQGVDARLVS